ncbi:MAG: disulfide bond formation protein B [Azonexus sp.]|nr:disulfide bond formation protein B [Azonexus sp.]MCK6411839.1 disulfide bond formation protein B [Azonexus sp.]
MQQQLSGIRRSPVLGGLAEAPARAWFAALSLGVFGLMLGGMTLQHLVRIAPCPLCIAQRFLYFLLAFIALGGVAWPAWVRFWSLLTGGVAFFGWCIAAYQTWMQAFPHLAPECSYTDPNLIERMVDWLGMQWPSLFLATGFCGSRDWEFVGLSLANWSLLAFTLILTLLAWLFFSRRPSLRA